MKREPDRSVAADTDAPRSAAWHGMEQPTAMEVVAGLDLSPHREGGYFRETYRAKSEIDTAFGRRAASTAILYLFTKSDPSRFHRLRSDEVWFYHAGALAELVLLGPAEASTTGRRGRTAMPVEQRVLGPDSPYTVVPGGWWLAARAIAGERTDWGAGRAPERRWTSDRRASQDIGWTLVSCVVTPGFDYADFALADRDTLLREYPLAKELIVALT